IPPWYKQFWPWFLIAIPAITIVSGVAMFLIASHKPDGMVVDDYYKSGLAINQTLERDVQARKLGLTAAGQFNLTEQSVQVLLAGKELPDRLKLTLTHPTAGQHDMVIALQQQKQRGLYNGLLDRRPAGRYYLSLEPLDQNWRLTGQLDLTQQDKWQLAPPN
ncbi:MAG: FixH family protein, partial [Gammaproteobacteria bacterium]|nr:FixH family protein [Gammaproteobacteria bacterium]